MQQYSLLNILYNDIISQIPNQNMPSTEMNTQNNSEALLNNIKTAI